MGKTQSGGQIRVTFTARKLEATTRGGQRRSRPSAMWLIQENASQEQHGDSVVTPTR